MGGGGGAEGRDLKVSRKFLGTKKMLFLKRKLLLALDTIVMANKTLSIGSLASKDS